jgi:hypothetical protein
MEHKKRVVKYTTLVITCTGKIYGSEFVNTRVSRAERNIAGIVQRNL